MDIHDVIGNFRLRLLEINKRLDAMSLSIHLLENRVERLERNDSAQSTLEDPDGNSIDSLPKPPTPEPAPAPRVGPKRARRDADKRDLRG